MIEIVIRDWLTSSGSPANTSLVPQPVLANNTLRSWSARGVSGMLKIYQQRIFWKRAKVSIFGKPSAKTFRPLTRFLFVGKIYNELLKHFIFRACEVQKKIAQITWSYSWAAPTTLRKLRLYTQVVSHWIFAIINAISVIANIFKMIVIVIVIVNQVAIDLRHCHCHCLYIIPIIVIINITLAMYFAKQLCIRTVSTPFLGGQFEILKACKIYPFWYKKYFWLEEFWGRSP